MKRSARVVFFGTEDFSSASLESLIEAGWDIVAVVTKPNSKAGRGQQLSSPAVKTIAQSRNIPVFQPVRPSEVIELLARFVPTHGVLVAYGAILPQELLHLFPGGIINLHPSLLPLYRGPSPIEAAILNGDVQTGLSLMQLDDKMDEGPVYAQKVVNLAPDENQITLSGKLSALGAHFLIEKLELITTGFLQPKPQDHSQATYTKLLKKEDGMIDFKAPADIAERQVRAYIRYPKTRTKLGRYEIIVTRARVANGPDDGDLVLKLSPGWLEIEELIGPKGTAMSGADFKRGYKFKLPG